VPDHDRARHSRISRRTFLSTGAAAIAVSRSARASPSRRTTAGARAGEPWFRRTYRWVQTNLNEDDPASYDQQFWTDYWRRTRAQGVIVNAGGIVAYYPTQYAWHHRADRLGDRDLFGEIASAAHRNQLTLLARMDSTRTYEQAYTAHPEWFARDRNGEPFRTGRLYTACVNGPWLTECVPAILREIAERYRPHGFTDNSWSGLGQDRICYCDRCVERFRQATGLALPDAVNWDDRRYREWIEWSYARRLELWDAHNRVTHEAGGADCHWMGMLQGDPSRLCADFRRPSGVLSRTPIVMLDWQARAMREAPYANAVAGKFLHSVAGWQVLAPESMPLYQGPSSPIFRHAAKPEAEVRLWAVEGFAGGIQPWFHHLGASQRDRRQFRAAEQLGRWHEAHQDVLLNREPVAAIGVVWSERNIDWYGRGASHERAMQPYNGAIDALVTHRLPWMAVDIDRLDEAPSTLRAIVLPNIAAMSDAQCDAVRRFAARGGGVVATGETSGRDEWGDARPELGLAALVGAHAAGESRGSQAGQRSAWSNPDGHSYLQFGDHPGGASTVLAGFDETTVLPFGGRLEVVEPAPDAQVALWWVPPYPASPPEDVRRGSGSLLPALLLRQPERHGRIAFLPADVDRCYTRDRLPDHGRLLANVVRWAAAGPMPVEIEGPGLLDVHVYRQPHRTIVHIVNLTNPDAWRAPATELYPVGPIRVRVRRQDGVRAGPVRLLVDAAQLSAVADADDEVDVQIASIRDHEVVVIG
jgi:hypothetical protein